LAWSDKKQLLSAAQEKNPELLSQTPCIMTSFNPASSKYATGKGT